VPPRFAGGWSPCRDLCLGEPWEGGELSGRAGCGVCEACADGCFCEGLAAGLFRVGAFPLGGLTVGVSRAADAIADGIAPLEPVPAPPSMVTTMMNTSTSAASSNPLDSMRSRLTGPVIGVRISQAALTCSARRASAQPTLDRIHGPRGTTRFTRYLRPLAANETFPVREDAARAF
jgi:hypothetical protein